MKITIGDRERKRILITGIVGSLTLLLAAVVIFVSIPRQAARATSGDWPTFRGGNGRTGFNASETSINPATAPNLKMRWSRKVKGKISAEPVEANGIIYWGGWSGIEHASRLSDGTDVWTANLGTMADPPCVNKAQGITSTATVTSVSIGAVTKTVVYVGGCDDNLYALDANTGAVIWQAPVGTVPTSYPFSSPAVF